MKTLRALAEDLQVGSTSSVELVEAALAAIDHPQGEGSRVFLRVDHTSTRWAARQADRARRSGRARSPFLGIPISIKDLFDIKGQVTRAGSKLLADSAPAAADAMAVQRLRNAGFVIVGRTNMTEFAYSGLGLNPHYGTPLNPYDRERGRIPGGSSSGAAVSVTDGMAAAAIGTDTGGSCRIPAAMCGLVGYKPTASRVPLDGVLPLSPSLDSVGPLARSVDCCAVLHATMSGATAAAPVRREPRALKLGVLRNVVFDDLDPIVAAVFDRALRLFSERRVSVVDVDFPPLNDLAELNAKGGLAAAEAYAWHRRHLQDRGHLYDPRVRARILKGAEQSAADYIDVVLARRSMVAKAKAAMHGFDGLIYPTVPIIAPLLATLDADAEYARINALALRNPSVANFLNTCAISIPIHQGDEAPVGLNILGHAGRDEELLSVAASLEALLQTARETP